MDRFTPYTHLVPLKAAATYETTFKKLQRTIFDVHGPPLSIVLDQDLRFTSKYWSQMMMSLDIQVWLTTQYHHQINSLVECRIRTLKQLMRNFINNRLNNSSGALAAIAAVINSPSHEYLGISRYQALYRCTWKIFNPVQRSTTNIAAVDEILNNHEAIRMEVDMARQNATFRQTVPAGKRSIHSGIHSLTAAEYLLEDTLTPGLQAGPRN